MNKLALAHHEIASDTRVLSPETMLLQGSATRLELGELRSILASPDSGKLLTLDTSGGFLVDDLGHEYPMRGSLPLLIPHRLLPYYSDHLAIPYEEVSDSALQYYFLSAVKQAGVVGDINASANDVHYQRHLFRMHDFLRAASGRVLDIGCDDPIIGAGLLPATTSYVGLDPFCRREHPFRIVGFGERLPFLDSSFESVVFNTSLDHIFDWRQALDEAHRVLVPGGKLFICSLVWTQRAGLLSDAVHFHHFRDYELFGALQNWAIETTLRYSYKDNDHRHGLYLAARKPHND